MRPCAVFAVASSYSSVPMARVTDIEFVIVGVSLLSFWAIVPLRSDQP